ncbi:MAG: outer membrane beta-barrel protein [Spirosomataceae bacterium]|jgi:hypothetical protein
MRFTFIIFLYIFSLLGVSAQKSRLTSNTTLSGSFGSSTYYGDMSPYSLPVRGILKSSSFNGAITLTKEFNERWAQNLDLRFTQLKGSDFKYNTNLFGYQEFLVNNFERNLHFRNNIFQVAYTLKYYVKENTATINRRRGNFLPYFIFGVGVATNNPKAKAPSSDGSGDWKALRPLHTSGSNVSYSPVFLNVPFGVGFNKKINRRWDFKAQAMLNVPFNDYLDDVSGTLFLNKEEFKNPDAFIFHNRSGERTDALSGKSRNEILLNNGIDLSTVDMSGSLRGSNSSPLTYYDMFVTTEIGLTYWLDWKIR